MEYYCLNMVFVFCEYVKFLFLLIKMLFEVWFLFNIVVRFVFFGDLNNFEGVCLWSYCVDWYFGWF